MISRHATTFLLVGLVLIGLVSINAVWAAPEQDSTRQTVPTRTPVPPTSKPEKDTPTPVPSVAPGTAVPGATSAPGTAVPGATSAPGATLVPGATLAPGQTPQVLPPAGATLVVPLAMYGVGALLVFAGWLAWRKTGR